MQSGSKHLSPQRQRNTYMEYSTQNRTTVGLSYPDIPSVNHKPDNHTIGWTELNMLSAIFSATSAIATSLILGANHADAAEITAVSMGHNDGIMLSHTSYPRFLRPLVWQFAPTCRELRSNAARLRMLMIAEFHRRVERIRDGKTPSNE
jgi:hypothetical protein